MGSTTSGGTESIFMAMFSLREYLRQQGYNEWDYEVIGAQSIHPAWNKAAYYFNMNLWQFKIDYSKPIQPKDFIKQIKGKTKGIILSGISFPNGVVDPVFDLNQFLTKNKKDVHLLVDSCLGGFFTSISNYLKDERFKASDFSLSKVKVITVDPHKYG